MSITSCSAAGLTSMDVKTFGCVSTERSLGSEGRKLSALGFSKLGSDAWVTR